MRSWSMGGTAFAILAFSGLVAADPRFGPSDVRTIFSIAKSDDRNQVQYGIHLDAECRPVGDEPVYAYWRQFERGADVTEDLNWMDRTVYAVRHQRIVHRGATSRVDIELRATSKRTIVIVARKDASGRCAAEAFAPIGNLTSARLERIFVQLGGFMSVRYLDIIGRDPATNNPVSERTKP